MGRVFIFCTMVILISAQSGLTDIPRTIGYQGMLTDTSDNPLNGSYDLTFRLYSTEMGGTALWTEIHPSVVVIKGIFNVILGSGGSPLTLPFDQQYWLSIQVGAGTELAPRLKLTSTPYSLNAWSLAGNSGTTPGINFLGTTDNVPLELRVNGERVLYMALAEDVIFTSTNIIGGYSGNIVGEGAVGATVFGGGTGEEDVPNTVGGYFGTVSGGAENTASQIYATVSGGASNTASGWDSTVPGGQENVAEGNWSFAAGRYAKATHPGTFVWSDSTATSESMVESTGDNQFLVRASGGAYLHGPGLTVSDTGDAVLVLEADTNDYGESDNPGIEFSQDGGKVTGFIGYESSNALTLQNKYIGPFGGGIYLYTDDTKEKGVYLEPGGDEWKKLPVTTVMKDNIREVNERDILNRLSRVPISQWSYSTQDPSIEHIGPMAQDFYAAFGLGGDDKSINSMDSDGVALAAIQGLYEIVQEKDVKIATQQEQIAALESRLAVLEKMVSGAK